MLSDRGSFSCFFRHSTDAAPFFYMKFWEIQIYMKFRDMQIPNPLYEKLVGEIMIDFAFIRKYSDVNYKGYSSKA